MADYRRTDRVNQLLREELSRLILRELKDPRVRTVTVTAVETTPDLEHATVHVRTLGEDVPVEEALRGLESAAGYLRRELGRVLHLRRVPAFEFEEDRTLERARRIEELLRKAREEDEDGGVAREGPGTGEGPEEPEGEGEGRAAGDGRDAG